MSGPTLGNPKNTIEILQKYNFSFQKKFGQNFLIDTHVLDKIIKAANITKDDLVLEIGPGIGHDCLHRKEAVQVGGLQEFNIFDMRDQRMEYEANMFAAQIALPDEEILEYIYGGYDVGQIARAMCSGINLVALKVSELNTRGYRFREQEHRSNFLK